MLLYCVLCDFWWYECLCVSGSQQFSSYSGFGDSFEWAGPHDDRLHRYEHFLPVSHILMYLIFSHISSLKRWVGSTEEADFSHGRSELQTQEGAVQYDQGHTGTQQGEPYLFFVLLFFSNYRWLIGNVVKTYV